MFRQPNLHTTSIILSRIDRGELTKTKNHIIKKTLLLVTAVMLAATSATYATKKIRIENKSGTTYYYKVGNTIKKISPGSSKSFPIPAGKKNVKIQAGTTKSGNTVQGDKKSFSYPKVDVKANPVIETNPVSGSDHDCLEVFGSLKNNQIPPGSTRRPQPRCLPVFFWSDFDSLACLEI